MIPVDELRGLGAVPHLNTELSLVSCHVITTQRPDWLTTHHAAEVHGGALLDEDAGAAQDLGVRLCNETFTIYQNLQIPNFCKDLKTIFQHLFYINSVEIAVPRLHRILIFVKMFLIFLILFINKPMNHRQANKLTIIFYWNFKISKDALYINSCIVGILLPATLR